MNYVLETLSFQVRIENGPMSLDLEHAPPEMKARRKTDAFGELTPASAVVLRNRLDKVITAWKQYMRLTAVNG